MRKIIVLLFAAVFTIGATESVTNRVTAWALKRTPQPVAIRTLSDLEAWRLHLFNATFAAGLTYGDYALMNEIVRCESSWRQFRDDGSVVVSSGNIGLAQINKWAHESAYSKMGLDVRDPKDNLTFAVHLFKTEGIKPWDAWSGHCWRKTPAFVSWEQNRGKAHPSPKSPAKDS